MPSLITGYHPAADPGVGVEAVSELERVGRPNPAGGSRNVNDQRETYGSLTSPPPRVELRTPGVDDRTAFHPAMAFTLRDLRDPDKDDWVGQQAGEHVAQTPGAAQPSGAQAPEPAMYGSTWRMEPQPADTGQYIGVTIHDG